MRFGPWGNTPLLTLFADVHSPWLLRFLPAVADLHERVGPGVEFGVVLTGGHRDVPAGAVFGDPDAVEREHRVHLCRSFRRRVSHGPMRLDSTAAAAGVIALLAAEEDGPGAVLAVLTAVTRAFLEEGADLSSPATVARIADRLGLDGPAVELFATSATAHDLALQDAGLALSLGVGRGATLLYSHQDRVVTLPGPGMRGRDLHRAVLSADTGRPTAVAGALRG